MSMVIGTNVASLTAQRHLASSQGDLQTSMERLASGNRINSAMDDAAGLAISNRMTAQIGSLNQSVRNANDSMALAQTAEGAMEEITSALNRMRELAAQAANSTYSSSDRESLNEEVTQLVSEINRIATDTEFNGIAILDGTFQSQDTFIGTDASHTESLSIGGVGSASLGVGSNASYSTELTSTSTTSNAALAAGDLVINGYEIGATSSDGVSTASADSSAIAFAAAINAKSGDTNVTASVNATALAGTAVTDSTTGYGVAITSGDIYINGVDLGAIDASASVAERGATVAAAVNAITDQTGVTATFSTSTGAVALSAADGRNIVLTSDDASGIATTVSGLGGAATSAASVTERGTITISSTDSAGITIGGASAGDAGLTDGYTAATATQGAGVSSLDISTASGATAAITILDAAIDQVATERGKLGAFQNRMEHAVNNLMNVSENTAAAKSRIQDADFATESANLAKAQVLQQAGTAMLAQANASTQNVLSLLK